MLKIFSLEKAAKSSKNNCDENYIVFQLLLFYLWLRAVLCLSSLLGLLQITRVNVQSSELGPPPPPPQAGVAPPLEPMWGEPHSNAAESVGEPNSDD
jgi:hypothetical protein